MHGDLWGGTNTEQLLLQSLTVVVKEHLTTIEIIE